MKRKAAGAGAAISTAAAAVKPSSTGSLTKFTSRPSRNRPSSWYSRKKSAAATGCTPQSSKGASAGAPSGWMEVWKTHRAGWPPGG